MNKKSNVRVVLLHCMGGNVHQLKRHIAFLKSPAHRAGDLKLTSFSTYTYSAFLHTPYSLSVKVDRPKPFLGLPDWRPLISVINKNRAQDILEIWAKELNQHLEDLPSGPKIIFSFSLPSVSALLTISRRKDIKALICDGGPFLNFPVCVYRLFSYYYQIPSVWLKTYLSAQMVWAFRSLIGGHIIKKINIPAQFPILSLQGAKDKQVHPEDINLFFQKLKTAKPKVCLLKKSDHLKGLKIEPELYKQTVLDFLKTVV